MKTVTEERLLTLLVYSLTKNTEIYNHELANHTMMMMKLIIQNNLFKSTDELTELLLNYWNNMEKYDLESQV